MTAYEASPKWLFIINPISGRRDKSLLPQQIAEFCLKNNIAYKTIETTPEFRAAELDRSINEYGPDTVIACGGDGTVNFVGRQLLNTEIALGIIPFGSSNALAKNLHVPIKTEEAFETLSKGRKKEIDTLDIDRYCCLHIFDIGFNASLIQHFHKSKIRGMVAYAWYLIWELFRYKNFRYMLETYVEKRKGKALSIIITNTKSYGTNVEINPKGKLDDGRFEVFIVRSLPGLSLLTIIIKLMNGSLHRSKYSHYLRTDSAVLNIEKGTSMHIDGEPVKLGENVEIKILPRSLKVIVPKKNQKASER